jgi:soluble lytic murein transglycosylase
MTENSDMTELCSTLCFSLRALVAGLMIATPLAHGNDAAVKDAAEGFRFGELRRVNAAIGPTRGNVLEGYVDYWALRLQLDNASIGTEVERFIAKRAGEAVADRLRIDWLKQLGKTGNWDRFASMSRGFDTDDSEIACYRTTLAATTDSNDPLPAPRGIWEERLTEACAGAFSALARRGQLTADDALWRFRTAADGGTFLAGARAAESLTADVRPSPEALQRAHSAPESYLNAGLAWQSRAHRQAGLYALTRLARSDAAKARALWSGIRGKFTDEEQRYAAGQLAYASARRLDTTEAMTWFKRTGDEQTMTRLGDWQAAWIARAALRAGAWSEVLRAINAMSPVASAAQTGVADPAWKYWKARALSELSDKAGAQAIYADLAKEFSFYGLLAAEEIGAPLPAPTTLKAGAVKPTPEDLKRFDQSAAAKRVLKLSELGLRADAAREWYSVVKDFNDVDSLIAAEWMRRKGIWDRSINTAERTKAQHDFGLRYQMPYAAEIRKAATQAALDHSLVFGLIRQESRFWAEAVSSAGALGLMQVMPATGKWIATKLKSADYRPSQLVNVDVNTGFGAFYLRTVLDQMGGSEPMAAASYNAGPGRARAWRADGPLEGAIYAESIPFNETRDYVRKVLTNAVWYAQLSGNGNTSIRSRLGIIPPK